MKQILIVLALATMYFPQRRLLLPFILRPPLVDLCIMIKDMRVISQWRVLQQIQIG